ncbi:hypothetical protein D3C75_739120 [compost metagenome]
MSTANSETIISDERSITTATMTSGPTSLWRSRRARRFARSLSSLYVNVLEPLRQATFSGCCAACSSNSPYRVASRRYSAVVLLNPRSSCSFSCELINSSSPISRSGCAATDSASLMNRSANRSIVSDLNNFVQYSSLHLYAFTSESSVISSSKSNLATPVGSSIG